MKRTHLVETTKYPLGTVSGDVTGKYMSNVLAGASLYVVNARVTERGRPGTCARVGGWVTQTLASERHFRLKEGVTGREWAPITGGSLEDLRRRGHLPVSATRVKSGSQKQRNRDFSRAHQIIVPRSEAGSAFPRRIYPHTAAWRRDV